MTRGERERSIVRLQVVTRGEREREIHSQAAGGD